MTDRIFRFNDKTINSEIESAVDVRQEASNNSGDQYTFRIGGSTTDENPTFLECSNFIFSWTEKISLTKLGGDYVDTGTHEVTGAYCKDSSYSQIKEITIKCNGKEVLGKIEEPEIIGEIVKHKYYNDDYLENGGENEFIFNSRLDGETATELTKRTSKYKNNAWVYREIHLRALFPYFQENYVLPGGQTYQFDITFKTSADSIIGSMEQNSVAVANHLYRDNIILAARELHLTNKGTASYLDKIKKLGMTYPTSFTKIHVNPTTIPTNLTKTKSIGTVDSHASLIDTIVIKPDITRPWRPFMVRITDHACKIGSKQFPDVGKENDLEKNDVSPSFNRFRRSIGGKYDDLKAPLPVSSKHFRDPTSGIWIDSVLTTPEVGTHMFLTNTNNTIVDIIELEEATTDVYDMYTVIYEDASLVYDGDGNGKFSIVNDKSPLELNEKLDTVAMRRKEKEDRKKNARLVEDSDLQS